MEKDDISLSGTRNEVVCLRSIHQNCRPSEREKVSSECSESVDSLMIRCSMCRSSLFHPECRKCRYPKFCPTPCRCLSMPCHAIPMPLKSICDLPFPYCCVSSFIPSLRFETLSAPTHLCCKTVSLCQPTIWMSWETH